MIPGLSMWVCEYRGQDGLPYGITLPASDPRQLEEDWCARFPEFVVLGELIEEIDE